MGDILTVMPFGNIIDAVTLREEHKMEAFEHYYFPHDLDITCN